MNNLRSISSIDRLLNFVKANFVFDEVTCHKSNYRLGRPAREEQDVSFRHIQIKSFCGFSKTKGGGTIHPNTVNIVEQSLRDKENKRTSG